MAPSSAADTEGEGDGVGEGVGLVDGRVVGGAGGCGLFLDGAEWQAATSALNATKPAVQILLIVNRPTSVDESDAHRDASRRIVVRKRKQITPLKSIRSGAVECSHA